MAEIERKVSYLPGAWLGQRVHREAMSKRRGRSGTATNTKGVLDALARQLSLVDHGELTRQVVAELVAYLEHLAQAPLGTTDGDPTVLLVRRITRAHQRLLTQPELSGPQLGQLGDYRQALGDPAAALLANCQNKVDTAPTSTHSR